MAVKIRLKRAGGKKRPFYRVVVIDSRSARDSRSVEDLGYYNPIETPTVFNVDRERVDYWIKTGAVVSDTVSTLLKRENTAHVARRAVPGFTADAPEIRRPKKGEGDDRSRGRKPVKVESAPAAESAVAVVEAPEEAVTAPVAETPAPAPEAAAEDGEKSEA